MWYFDVSSIATLRDWNELFFGAGLCTVEVEFRPWQMDMIFGWWHLFLAAEKVTCIGKHMFYTKIKYLITNRDNMLNDIYTWMGGSIDSSGHHPSLWCTVGKVLMNCVSLHSFGVSCMKSTKNIVPSKWKMYNDKFDSREEKWFCCTCWD